MENNEEEVYIAAAPGSRRFDKIHQAVNGASSAIVGYDVAANIDGVDRSEPLGEYEKQKFPGTQQHLKPNYRTKLGRFIIQRRDGTEWTQEELQKACDELQLLYPRSHPKAGQTITRVNIKDVDDAFINHSIFVQKLLEGDGTFPPSSTQGDLKQAMFRGHPAVMDETADGIRSQEVEFLIRDPQVRGKAEESVRELKELAFELYTAMKTDPDRMRQILAMFGVFYPETASASTLRTAVFAKMDDGTSRANGATPQEQFVKYANFKPDELKLQSIVATAVHKSVIWEKAGIYEYSGSPLGSTFESTVEFLRKKANESVLDRIQIELKEIDSK